MLKYEQMQLVRNMFATYVYFQQILVSSCKVGVKFFLLALFITSPRCIEKAEYEFIITWKFHLDFIMQKVFTVCHKKLSTFKSNPI